MSAANLRHLSPSFSPATLPMQYLRQAELPARCTTLIPFAAASRTTRRIITGQGGTSRSTSHE